MLHKRLPLAALATLAITVSSSAVERMVAPVADGAGWHSIISQAGRTATVVFVTVLLVEFLLAWRIRATTARQIAAPPGTDPNPTYPASTGAQPGTPHVGVGAPGPHPDDWDEVVGDEISEIAPLADHVYAMHSLVGYEAELSDTAFVRIDDLRWLLANYVIKGGRVRRLINLPRLLSSRGDNAQESELHRAATALLHAIRNTNAHVADWLLAHRVAIPDPDLLDTNGLLDRHLTMSIEPMTVSADPLYLLTCHIHDVLETTESLGDLEHPLVESLEAALVRPLSAIDHELTATMAFNAAVLAATRTARSQAS